MAVALQPAQAQSCSTYQEQSGLLIVELEFHNAFGNWKNETTWPGYAGASYLRWDGPDMFSTPGVDSLRYDFHIQTPGTYRLALHNRHNHPDSSQENDAWVRFDGQNWVKAYSNTGSGPINVWNFETRFEVGSSHVEPEVTLAAGDHSIEISGRSRNFMIDRFHLALIGHPQAKEISASHSSCAAGNASTYCVPQVNSLGCTPAVGVPSGQPSTSSGQPFVVTANQIVNAQFGVFFYGYQPTSVPFQGGTLCVQGPWKRTPVQNSGGNGNAGTDCSGSLAMDVNAWLASGQDPQLTPGTNMFGQFWYRDQLGVFGTGLTDAAAMTVQP